MAEVVREIMNPEVFALKPDDPGLEAAAALVDLGISGAPVVVRGRAVGVVSLRDLVGLEPHDTVGQRMSSPAVMVGTETRLVDATALFSELSIHRAVVADDAGLVVGVISTLDLLRGLTGLPVKHPPSFPHLDSKSGLRWSDEAVLEPRTVERAPAESGVFVIIEGGAGKAERVVWAEAAKSLRERLQALLHGGPEVPPQIRDLLTSATLRFRTAEAVDFASTMRALHTAWGRERGQEGSVSP